jgi:hypothetical protein
MGAPSLVGSEIARAQDVSRGHEPCGSRGALPAGSGSRAHARRVSDLPAAGRGRARLARPLATASPNIKWENARDVTDAQAMQL